MFKRNILALLAAVFLAPALLPAQQTVSAPDDLVARAREAYNNRRFREAANIYGDYLKNYPQGKDRDEAGFFFGQSLFLLNDLAGADAALAREEQVNKGYADQILFYRGEIAGRRREFSGAMVYYDRLLAEFPASALADKAVERRAELHFRQGEAYFCQGAYSLALQQYGEAAGAPAELKELIAYRRGQCHQKLGETEQAAEACAAAAGSAKAGGPEAALLSLYRLARLLEDQKKFAGAEEAYGRFLDLAPDHYLAPLVREGLARSWAGQGKSREAEDYWRSQGQGKELLAAAETYQLAIDHYVHEEYGDAAKELKALAASGDQELAWAARLWLARVLSREGRNAEALAAWKELSDSPQATDAVRLEHAQAALATDPALAARLAGGVAARTSGPSQEEALRVSAEALWTQKSPEAAGAADNYLARFPAGRYSADMHLIRGLSLAERNDPAAEKELQAVIATHAEAAARGRAALALAGVYRLQGRPESALEVVARSRDDVAGIATPAEDLLREEAGISFARGDYQRGLLALGQLCPGKACTVADRERVFFGNYRAGKGAEAQEALAALEADPQAAFFAGFWQGMMFYENGDYAAAADCFRQLDGGAPLEQAMVWWQVARAESRAGRVAEAQAALKKLDETAPEAGFYTRGQKLSLALAGKDFATFLASLPSPADQDKEALAEDRLLAALREQAATAPAGLAALNRVLQAEATREEVAEEGTLIVARAGLYGPGRAEALASLDRILVKHPGSPLAPQVKFYRAEDAFLKQDWQGTQTWLAGVEAIDLPDDLRFPFLYYQGQSAKQLRDLDRMRPSFLLIVKEYRRPAEARRWLDVGIGLTLAREFSAARTALDQVGQNTKDARLLVEATYWKGMVEAGTGNQDAALATFLSVQKNFPDQGMWVTTALYEAAGIYTEKGQYDQALATYEKALALCKGDATTTNAIKGKIAEVKKLKGLKKAG